MGKRMSQYTSDGQVMLGTIPMHVQLPVAALQCRTCRKCIICILKRLMSGQTICMSQYIASEPYSIVCSSALLLDEKIVATRACRHGDSKRLATSAARSG